MPPPHEIGGARVLFYAEVVPENWEGRTRHIVDGELAPAPEGLAVCQYEGDPGFYLFGCASDWSTITDTYHDSVADAIDQAEYECGGSLEFYEAAA